jgi:hypothetical protein
MMMPAGFLKVPTSTFSSTKESLQPPRHDFDFRGLLLTAPKEVTFLPGRRDALTGGFARIPGCVTYVLDHGALGLDGQFVHSVVFVAVDAATQEAFSGRMDPPSAAEPPPTLADLDLTPDDMKDVVITGYFNPDLVEVLGLPAREATYLVHAALGPYTSGVVRIRVRSEKK